ncbi:MAG: peptidoglycan editing factor PgeF [Cyanobacteria bacterium SID2]|nr:peptidoglycan editing factor PgeF [Cyanobacteria bacterium SID2]MBP0006014.1 peptidoglycan editing factor PgeF [Cyanobacteria bacterium SBC]
MTTWQWQTWQGKSYLTCRLLEPFTHGFFTQQFRPQTPQDLVRVLAPNTPAYRTQQVHGNAIAKTVDLEPMSPHATHAGRVTSSLHEADGILTHAECESVWVCSADCTPVLVADTQTGRVAAIHAGWRGTAAKIVPTAIEQFRSNGSQLENLRVALGPAISGEVYQVSSEVAAEVGASILSVRDDTSPDTILEELNDIPQPPVLPDLEPGKVRLDVRRAIVLQLDRLGIQPEQIAVSPHCTYQDPDRFFSYRRTGEKNVQWSGIVSH